MTHIQCRLLLNVTVITLFVCRAALAQESQGLPAKEKFHLFLMAGQSNMAGRGRIAEEDLKPHPRVLMLTESNEWKPAVAPLHFDKPKVVGVGVGRAFAIQVADANPEITVGLIPCAVGGSPISSWMPGAYYTATKSHPYDDAIKRTQLALNAGVLKGILWHQGESDAKSAKAKNYEKNLHDLIHRFRSEFDSPNLPFLAGQMGQFAERPWDESKQTVDRAHRQLPEKILHTDFVNSDRLTHNGDKVHFDTKSYRELGRRYAAAYLNMMSSRHVQP
jgi:hypothetical protein